MERLERIKSQYVSENDIDWLIEQAEKVEELSKFKKDAETLFQRQKLGFANLAEKIERYEKALKWIVENFDSDKSGLSDEEYHKEMIKKANESLKC